MKESLEKTEARSIAWATLVTFLYYSEIGLLYDTWNFVEVITGVPANLPNFSNWSDHC